MTQAGKTPQAVEYEIRLNNKLSDMMLNKHVYQ